MKAIRIWLLTVALVGVTDIALASEQRTDDSLILVCDELYPTSSIIHLPVYVRVNARSDTGLTALSLMFWSEQPGLSMSSIEWDGTALGENSTAIQRYIGDPAIWAMENRCSDGTCLGGVSLFTVMAITPHIPSGHHLLCWLVVETDEGGAYLMEPRNGLGSPPLNNSFAFSHIASYPVLVGCTVIVESVGAVGGIVRDMSSVAIPGAVVTAFGPSPARSVSTDAAGFYLLEDLPVGTYDVIASDDGHIPHAASGVVVVSNETTTVNFELRPGTPCRDSLIFVCGRVVQRFENDVFLPVYARVCGAGQVLDLGGFDLMFASDAGLSMVSLEWNGSDRELDSTAIERYIGHPDTWNMDNAGGTFRGGQAVFDFAGQRVVPPGHHLLAYLRFETGDSGEYLVCPRDGIGEPPLENLLRYGFVTVHPTLVCDTVHTQVTGRDDEPALPKAFSLRQNYPNPFNPATIIRFDLPEDCHVTLTIYNVAGVEVAQLVDGELPAGRHQVSWVDGSIPSGVYFCQMEAGDYVATRKMVLLQ